MTETLWDIYLPIIQQVNEYGGFLSSFQISKYILDIIEDRTAAGDAVCSSLKAKIYQAITQFKGLQDYRALSEFYEAYYEAVFYLVADQRGVFLREITAGANRGNTPDFESMASPKIGFEVKTINVADPTTTYSKAMWDGMNARIDAYEAARQRGIGTGASVVSPHGEARDLHEVIEQIMKKIDGNVKQGQYAAAPTFLVVAVGRTALHADDRNLKKQFVMYSGDAPINGQLWTVAAHHCDECFFFYSEKGIILHRPLNRNGILLDHDFIAGIIFLETIWHKINSSDYREEGYPPENIYPLQETYQLKGIYNFEWEKNSLFSSDQKAAARAAFQKICHVYNDTDDIRSSQISD
ncbi:MAG: hypothetical protein PHW76_08410 [Alphaproteobacteria bacterium]|nr:hypothetical protein [Alphaproteobacteria bacterium]